MRVRTLSFSSTSHAIARAFRKTHFNKEPTHIFIQITLKTLGHYVRHILWEKNVGAGALGSLLRAHASPKRRETVLVGI